jgi:hypothetical protein
MLYALSAQAGGIGDLFGAIAGRFNSYGSGREGQQKQFEDALAKVSEYMNKHMPESVDQFTRLDRVSAEPGPHFSYHYTLLNLTGSEVDKESFVNTIRPQLKGKLCDNAQIRNFFNHGVTVSYIYQGNDGKPIGGAEFAPNSCDALKAAANL